MESSLAENPSAVSIIEEEDVDISDLALRLFNRDVDYKSHRFRRKSFAKESIGRIGGRQSLLVDDEGAEMSNNEEDWADAVVEEIKWPVEEAPGPYKDARRGIKRVRFADEVRDSVFPHGLPLPPPPPPLPSNFFEGPILRTSGLPQKTNPQPPPPPPPPLPPLPVLSPRNLSATQTSSSRLPANMFNPSLLNGDSLTGTALKLYTRFMSELAEFAEFQESVTVVRTQVQQKRLTTSFWRNRVSDCDMKFFDYLRKRMDCGSIRDDPQLVQLFEASGIARDELGTLESDLEALELELGDLEFDLKEQYDAIERRYNHILRFKTSISSDATSDFSFATEALESDSGSGSRPDEEHKAAIEVARPKFNQSRTALVDDTLQVSEFPKEVSALHGTNLLKGSNKSTKSRILGSITGVVATSISSRKEILGNREERLERTLMGIGGFIPGFQDAAYGLDGSGSSDLYLKGLEHDISALQKIAYGPTVEEPLLLSSDSISSKASQQVLDKDEMDTLLLLGTDHETQWTLSDYLLSFNSRHDRINRWLLHKLRVSPCEFFELERQVRSRNELVADWVKLALDCWDEDNAGDVAWYLPGSEESRDAARHQLQPNADGTRPQLRARSKRRKHIIIDRDLVDWPPVEEISQGMPAVEQEQITMLPAQQQAM
ncbi:hypothetical protein BDV96DRAFT_647638 [Lophiotrema nucula]|uniref:Uncharacterized protein n=1 Tax=Lophiotrema nucula TaxID=690887 RepID=A0A6A5Z426_9PLEO|nr:hypothetical protein BDV96DRAFT_647638 [Lophiotrema nucula]